MTANRLFIAGLLLLTAAAATSGLTEALVTAGISTVVYAPFRALADAT